MEQLGFSPAEIERSRALHIDEALLRVEHLNFPQGQIVGQIKSEAGLVPASLLSTVIRVVRNIEEIPRTYDEMTTGRTFMQTVPLTKVAELIANGWIALLSCVSVAVDPQFQSTGIAKQTLDVGIALADRYRLVAAPYSGPRDFGAFLKKHPGTDVFHYLMHTKPHDAPSYDAYVRKLGFLNSKRERLLRGTYKKPLEPLAESVWKTEQGKEAGIRAYLEFLHGAGRWFENEYGRKPTVVDFIRITGRRHIDMIMDAHTQNGADFIYGTDGNIRCVFQNGRPEDVFSAGYNIMLVYHPCPQPQKY